MKVYAIGGLGADARVFKFLQLDCEMVPINWIENFYNESISNYAERISEQIDNKEPFVLLGVSFGGIIAQELCKFIQPEKLVLISTIERDSELSWLYKVIGKSNALHLLPKLVFKMPKFAANFLFGTKNPLLYGIIRDTNPGFVKWALNQIFIWKNVRVKVNVIRIHGENDLLFTKVESNSVFWIKETGHFAIVDKGAEISEVINRELKF